MEKSRRIVGAQMMCARATDMISQFELAIVNGLTLEQMAAVVYPHPTYSEAIGEAVSVSRHTSPNCRRTGFPTVRVSVSASIRRSGFPGI